MHQVSASTNVSIRFGMQLSASFRQTMLTSSPLQEELKNTSLLLGASISLRVPFARIKQIV
ncbi:unnamed protein product [Hymenolepis diminuta]|uniref:Uncharacterized protein n=1 Tax=Hymenolepis diminuta TaxID=6216 RepID=A0A564ZC06_HYMDI|nr:unnamed protein product [Hymenolepis diminuta]